MNKIIILNVLLVILHVSSSYSQRKLEFSLSYSPLISYRTLTTTNDFEVWSDYLQELDSVESSTLGFKIQFGFNYYINSNFFIASGLTFKKVGEEIEVQTIIWGYSDPFIIAENIGTTNSTYNNEYHYISIPISINQNIRLTNKFAITPQLGINIDFLTKNSIYIGTKRFGYLPDNWTYNKVALGINAGINFRYEIVENFEIYIKPYYGRSITPNGVQTFSDDSGIFGGDIDTKIRQYNYNYGLDFGLAYSINGE